METNKIYYFDGEYNKVDKSTKTAVENAYRKVQSTINPDFTNKLSIHVTSDFSNLPDNVSLFSNYLKTNEGSFSSTRGITTDDMNKREIFIQESAFWPTKLLNIFSSKLSFSANEEIEQTAMHEFGHAFDYYYGSDKNLQKEHQKLSEKYGQKQFEPVELLPEEEKIMKEYLKNNGYSDKKDFKDALAEDFKLLKLNFRHKQKFGYLFAEFYNRGLEITPDINDIELADYSRGEVFAQLFSYAMGTDDGNKDEFIKLLPNTYKIVQQYIHNHSK